MLQRYRMSFQPLYFGFLYETQVDTSVELSTKQEEIRKSERKSMTANSGPSAGRSHEMSNGQSTSNKQI